MRCSVIGFFVGLLLLFGCSEKSNPNYTPNIKEWNDVLTKVIMEDVFTPPVSARIYAYSNLAAFEILRQEQDSIGSFAKVIKGFPSIVSPSDPIDFKISSLVAYCTVSEFLVLDKARMNISEHHKMTDYFEGEVEKLIEEGFDQDIINSSINYGQEVAKEIIKWTKSDHYKQRSYPIFKVVDTLGGWKPTPPSFLPAVEPNWNTVRTFFIDSADQFNISKYNTPFDIDPNSTFYKEAYAVYNSVKQVDSNRVAIAKYWDCNPNVVIGYSGNIKLWSQKISPGGHWISIASQACEQYNLSLTATSFIVSSVAMSLHDAFVSCWDMKYKTNLIRPETYIRQYIDPEWVPILETPAFPEHTSGHSVVSTAAATILTSLIGDNMEFTDATEEFFGMPSKTFPSFYAASEEAAISRFYGGIHYLPAAEKGKSQGKELGNYVTKKISLLY